MKTKDLIVTLLAIALPLTAACESPFGNEPDTPSDARVLIEGEADASLDLITSNDFEQVRTQGSGDLEIRLIEADTANVGVPFDERLPLGPSARILVRLSNADTVPTEIRMQVFLGSEKKYDQTALLDEQTLQFAWTYF